EQYEVLEYLGGGGFADVYRVHNPADELEYALKVYRPGTLDAVRRELRPLRRVDHPNILNAHWGGRLRDGTWFVALDVVTGVSLRTRLRERGPLDVCELRDLGTQLLEALAAIHESRRV